jgi:hypothetical protein
MIKRWAAININVAPTNKHPRYKSFDSPDYQNKYHRVLADLRYVCTDVDVEELEETLRGERHRWGDDKTHPLDNVEEDPVDKSMRNMCPYPSNYRSDCVYFMPSSKCPRVLDMNDKELCRVDVIPPEHPRVLNISCGEVHEVDAGEYNKALARLGRRGTESGM